jgi:hypothetical protein
MLVSRRTSRRCPRLHLAFSKGILQRDQIQFVIKINNGSKVRRLARDTSLERGQKRVGERLWVRTSLKERERCVLGRRQPPTLSLPGNVEESVKVQLQESVRLRKRDVVTYRMKSRLKVRSRQHVRLLRCPCCITGELDASLPSRSQSVSSFCVSFVLTARSMQQGHPSTYMFVSCRGRCVLYTV